MIEQREISNLTNKNGTLNSRGKDLVETALRGYVIPNYDLLQSLSPGLLRKIDRAIPAMARLKARGERWDISNLFAAALRQIVEAEKGKMPLGEYFARKPRPKGYRQKLWQTTRNSMPRRKTGSASLRQKKNPCGKQKRSLPIMAGK